MSELGSLKVSLQLDTTSYDATLVAYKAKTASFGKELEASLRIGNFKLTPKVDDRALTALNKHLDLKKRHFQEVQTYFDRNPLTIRVDDTALKKFSALKTSTGTVQVKLELVDFSKDLSKALKDANKEGFNPLKNVGSLASLPLKALGFAINKTFEGSFNRLGSDISGELSKGIADGVNKSLSPLIGSFNLVGRELGEAITDEMIKSLGRNISPFQRLITETLGADKIAVESGSIRASQRSAQRSRQASAIEYYSENFSNTDRKALRLENQKIVDRAKEISELSNALAARKSKELEKLGAGKLEAEIAAFKSDISKLRDDKANADDEKARRQIETQIKSLSRKLQIRNDRLEDLEKQVEKQFEKETQRLYDLVDRTATDQYYVNVKTLEALGNERTGAKVKASQLPARIESSRVRINEIKPKRDALLESGKTDRAALKDIDSRLATLLPEPKKIQKAEKLLADLESEYEGLASVLKASKGSKRDEVLKVIEPVKERIARTKKILDKLKSSPNFQYESLNKEIESLETKANEGEDIEEELAKLVLQRDQIASSEGFNEDRANDIDSLKKLKINIEKKQAKRIALIKQYNEQIADEERELEGLLAQSDIAKQDPRLQESFKSEVIKLSKLLSKNEKELVDSLLSQDQAAFNRLIKTRAELEAKFNTAYQGLQSSGGSVDVEVASISKIKTTANRKNIQQNYDKLIVNLKELDEKIVTAIADNNTKLADSLKIIREKVIDAIASDAVKLKKLGGDTGDLRIEGLDALDAKAQIEKVNKPFRSILEEVAEISGADVSKIPQIKIDKDLPKELGAGYVPENNTVNVTQEMFDRAASGSLTKEDFKLLIHELRHAIQTQFGEISLSDAAKRADLLKPNKDEISTLGANIETSVRNTTVPKDIARKLESDAYTFAERFTDTVVERVQSREVINRFNDRVGIGGGKLKAETADFSTKVIGKLNEIADSSAVDISEEYRYVIRKIESSFAELENELSRANLVDELPVDEIGALGEELAQTTLKIQKQIIGTIAELKEIAANKPDKVREQFRDLAPQFSKKKDLVPLAESLGIEDAQKLSKKQLINRIANETDLKELQPKFNDLTRRRAQQQLERQERIAAMTDTAQTAGMLAVKGVGATARGVGAATRFIGQTGQAIGRNPAFQAMARVGRATGMGLAAAGRTAYGILEGAEGIALDALPFARTAKGIGQNVVLPMALTAAAQHYVPGAGAAIEGAQGMIQGAIQPLVEGQAAEAIEIATGVIKHVVPNVMGMQAHAIESVTSGIQSIVSSGVGTAAEGIAAIGAGRVIQTAATRPLKGITKQQPKALPGSQQKALPGKLPEDDLNITYIYEVEKSLRDTYKQLQKEVKKKNPDTSKIQQLGSIIADLKTKADKELTAILSNLSEDYAAQFGSELANKIGGAKGRISQAANKAERILKKHGVERLHTEVEVQPLSLPPATSIKKPAKDPEYIDIEVSAEELKVNPDELYGTSDIIANFKNLIRNATNRTSRQAAENVAQKIEEITADIDTETAEANAVIAQKIEEIEKQIEEKVINQTEAIKKVIEKRKLNASEVAEIVGSAENVVAEGYNPENLASVQKYEAASVRIDVSKPNSVEAFNAIEEQINEEYQASIENLEKTLQQQAEGTLEGKVKIPGLEAAKQEFLEYMQAINDGLQSFGINTQGFDTFLGSIANKLPDGIGAANDAIKNLLSNTGFLVKGFLAFQVLTFVAPLFGRVADETTKLAAEFERLENILDFGSGGNATSTIEFINSEVERLNINLAQAYSAYGKLAATSKDTPLEGEATKQSFTAIAQASALYGLDTQQQERAFTALSQIISKGTVSAEELKGQLAEAIPGAVQIAARALNVTTGELQKMLELGAISSSEFVPKFAQQLQAETNLSAEAGAETTIGKMMELENSITRVKKSIGDGLLPAKNLGLDASTAALKVLGDNITPVAKIATVLAGVLTTNLAVGLLAAAKGSGLLNLALMAMAGGFKLLIPNLKAFGLQMVAFQLAIEVIGMIGNAFKDGGGEIRNFANSAKAGLEEYERVLAKAQGKTEDFANSTKKLKGESLLGQTALGMILPKELLGGIEELGVKLFDFQFGGLMKLFGKDVVTNAEKVANDISLATNELTAATNESVSKMFTAIGDGTGSGEIKQLKELDQQIANLQQRRRAIDPSDTAGINKLQTEIDEKIKQRETLSAPVQTASTLNQSNITALEETLKIYDENLKEGRITQEQYEREVASVKSTLDAARKAQELFNKAIGQTVDKISALVREMKAIEATRKDKIADIEKESAQDSSAIDAAKLNGLISEFDAGNSKLILEQETLGEKIKANIESIERYKKVLNDTEVQQALTAYGLQDAGAERIRTEIENNPKISGTTDEKILNNAATALENIDSLETEVANYTSSISENRMRATQSIRDANKSIADYIKATVQQFEDLENTVKSTRIETEVQAIKNKFQSRLKGFGTRFFGEFTNSLMDLVDTFYEPMRNALKANSDIQGFQRQLQDKLAEGQSLNRQYTPTNNTTVPFQGVIVTSAVDASGEPGLDYVVSEGQRGAKFGALAEGEVIEVRRDDRELGTGGERGYGNTVIVRTVDEATGEIVDMLYAHLDDIMVNVGDRLGVGSVIGTQGRTGSTTGAHVSVDFFGKDSANATSASLAMRDRMARILANNPDSLNAQIQQVQTQPASTPSVPSGQHYRPRGGTLDVAERVQSDPLGAQAIISTAQRLQLDPLQFAALMSWESGGSLNPNVMGGDGNAYQGLIQFSPDNQNTYGIKPNMSIAEQMPAIERYLIDRGFKPGQMDIRGAYSAILTGDASQSRWDWPDSNGTTVWNAESKFTGGDHYERGRQFLQSSGVSGNLVSGVGQIDTSGIQRANNVAVESTNAAIQATEEQLAVFNEKAAIEYRQKMEAAARRLRDDSEDLDDLTIQRQREQEDRLSAALPQTPQTQYDIEMRNITRAEEDATRDINRDVRDIEESLEQLKESRAFLEEFGKTDPRVLELIPNTDEAIKKAEEDLDDMKRVQEEAGKSFDMQRQALIDKYKLEENARELSRESGALSLDRELNDELAILERRSGRGFNTIADAGVFNERQINLDIDQQLQQLEEEKTALNLSNEEYERRKELLEELRGLKLEENNAAIARQEAEYLREANNAMAQSNIDVNSAVVENMQVRGVTDSEPMRELQKESAMLNQQMDFQNQLAGLQTLREEFGYTNEQITAMEQNLYRINEIKLDTIGQQFSVTNDMVKTVSGSFANAFAGLISGSMDAKEALISFLSSIASQFAQQGIQMLLGELLGGFGGAMGGGMTGGFGGMAGILAGGDSTMSLVNTGLSLFSSVIGGFSEGGVIEKTEQGLRDRDDMIGQALRKEGPDSVLAALTPGERVLSVAQNEQFTRLGLDKVLNFKAGGIVGDFNPASGKLGGTNVTVNAPVTLNGGSEGDVDAKSFEKIIQRKIQETIIEESRPNGSLDPRLRR